MTPLCCGGLTRTDDLWVMSPTSCQLLHSAYNRFFLNRGAKIRTKTIECKQYGVKLC